MIDYSNGTAHSTLITVENHSVKHEPYEPFIDDRGIFVPLQGQFYECIMTKEMFIEAYKRYILNNTGEITDG